MRRNSMRLVLAVCLAALLAVGLAGCTGGATSGGPSGGTSSGGGSSSGGTTAGGTTITEDNFAFSPATATVKVGDTVTFTNNDSAPHNVQIDGKELGSQGQGESKTWTASKAGAFPYTCIIHPSMTGEITVQ
jgi:plastocyanin